MTDDNIYRQGRLEKAQGLRAAGINPYANGIKPTALASELKSRYDAMSPEDVEKIDREFVLSGRVVAIRSFGKAGFVQLRDRSGELQVFTQKGKMGEAGDVSLKNLDIGDFVCVRGPLFRTKTNELTIRAEEFRLVTKSLQTLPEKWHGLTDVEARYRRRYVDLIANPEVKDIFVKRSKIVSFIRNYFQEHDFLEVETPMMHPIPGGAKARPFVTHHNTLDRELYLRIAPELYLKRLVVGGMERVFELNRNFRNEGISTQHNPEFTMLEFYMSYATYEDLIALTEDLLNKLAANACGSERVTYQGKEISFAKPFARYTLAEALQKHLELDERTLSDRQGLLEAAKRHRVEIRDVNADLGVLQLVLFEECVEKKLISPTFITHFPISVSPLSRRSDAAPELADRFELFINGREIANAFSELNDPIDQRERFMCQVAEREAGDDEAMYCDEDFVLALEYGMPPTAGEGIGIDRLVMLLTDAASIRDVILFPILRGE
jgi:lysyl-tRNA synthetase class 2